VLSNYSASFSEPEDVDMKCDEESKIASMTRKEHLAELTKYDIIDFKIKFSTKQKDLLTVEQNLAPHPVARKKVDQRFDCIFNEEFADKEDPE